VEQVVRPTGLLEPPIEIRPVVNQVDDLLDEIDKRISKGDRVLVTTDAYMAALGPEPAAVTLRRTPEEAATLQRVGPKDLRALGFADRLVKGSDAGWALAAEISALAGGRAAARDWSRPLGGRCVRDHNPDLKPQGTGR